jgi:hypothetical protein
MTNLEGTFTDISGTKNVHYSTGGTEVNILLCIPIQMKNIFKGSKETPLREIRYPNFGLKLFLLKLGNFRFSNVRL